MLVVKQGRHPVKSYGAKKFFVVQAAILFSKGGVPFMWNSSGFLVKRHTVLFAGSLQI